MNKLTVMLVVLTASAAFGSTVHKTKEPVSQLEIMYRHCPSEPERAAVRNKAGVKLSLEIDRVPNYTDEVTVPKSQLQAALKSLHKSHVDVERITPATSDEPMPTNKHIKDALIRVSPQGWLGDIFGDPGYVTK